jgi:hypothetical protein
VRLTQSYVGKLTYYPEYTDGFHRLLVAVPCLVGDLTHPIHALLDTASEWCVLPGVLVQALGYDVEPHDILLHSRLGTFPGRLERAPVRFSARAGDTVEVEATWFVSIEWPGPMVIGWKGCLERLRFALDPGEDSFYFAGL